jgi:hypothetical protein
LQQLSQKDNAGRPHRHPESANHREHLPLPEDDPNPLDPAAPAPKEEAVEESKEEKAMRVARQQLAALSLRSVTVSELKRLMSVLGVPSGKNGVKTNVGGPNKRTLEQWLHELRAFVQSH